MPAVLRSMTPNAIPFGPVSMVAAAAARASKRLSLGHILRLNLNLTIEAA